MLTRSFQILHWRRDNNIKFVRNCGNQPPVDIKNDDEDENKELGMFQVNTSSKSGSKTDYKTIYTEVLVNSVKF